MIRVGARGAGQWRKATWDEALDYVAGKLKDIIKKHGPQSVVFGERTNLNTHISKTFMKALGSPNHFTHDALCKGSVNTAFRSLTGYTDAQVGIDYANTRYIIMYGRNIFESLEIKPINNLLSAMEKGAKLTYIDPRVSHHGHQGRPLLDDPAGHRSGPQLRPDPHHLEGEAARSGLRPPLGQGAQGPASLCGALYPGVGRAGDGDSRR